MELQTPNLWAMFQQGRQQGVEQKRQKTLADFFQKAAGGDADALGKVYAVDQGAGMDAQQFGAQQQKLASDAQATRQTRLGKNMRMLAQAAKSGNHELAGALYAQFKPEFTEDLPGLPLPEQWDPAMAAKTVEMADALDPQDYEGVVVNGNLVDKNSGHVMFTAPDQRKILKVEYADDGTPYNFYSDGSYEPARPGGAPSVAMPAPTTGGGGQVLEDAVSQAITPLGGRITSTTGGRHNPGSKHYSGNAIDVGMGRESPEQQAQIIAALQADPSLLVRDERTRPPGQQVWGGPHVHVERRGQGGPTFGGKNKPLSPAEQQRLQFEQQRLDLARRAADRADASQARSDQQLKLQQQAQRSKPLSGDVANKVGLYDNGLKAAKSWVQQVVNPDGTFNDLKARSPGVRSLLNQAIRAKLRAESGAAISEAELDGEVSRYLGGFLSSDADNARMARTLVEDLTHQRDVLVSGRAGDVSSPGAAPRRVTNAADYNVLPSGAVYVTPDGVTRRKK